MQEKEFIKNVRIRISVTAKMFLVCALCSGTDCGYNGKSSYSYHDRK